MKKLLLITIPILLLAAACNKQAAQVQPVQTAPVPAYEAPLDMSNWKTYTNKQFGFSVRHPQNYNVAEKPDSVVLSSADYSLVFTKTKATIRSQISDLFSWELGSMTHGGYPATLQTDARHYIFSYFTGDANSLGKIYLFINHKPQSVGDDELGAYDMVKVMVQGDSEKDNLKAQQEGITNMDSYAYEPDFMLATFKFTK